MVRQALSQGASLDEILPEPVAAEVRAAVSAIQGEGNGIGAPFLTELSEWVGADLVALAPSANESAAGLWLCHSFAQRAEWGGPMLDSDHILRRHHARTFFEDPDPQYGKGDRTIFFPLNWSLPKVLDTLKEGARKREVVAAVQRAVAAGLDYFRASTFAEGALLTIAGHIISDQNALLQERGRASPLEHHLFIEQFFPVGTPSLGRDEVDPIYVEWAAENDPDRWWHGVSNRLAELGQPWD